MSIAFCEVKTLKDFYGLMAQTRDVRCAAVDEMYTGAGNGANAVPALKNALASLENISRKDGSFVLELDAGKEIAVDLSYEINELKKDILFLEHGETALLDHLAAIHKGFAEHVEQGLSMLKGRRFTALISDRDGTTNNYCGRYRSSIQSIYNSLFLAAFAKERVDYPVFMTSAPLEEAGIVEVSVNPPGSFVYAASKGREYIDLKGVRHSYPIDAGKQALLDKINTRLSEMAATPQYEKFSLIGSGLQFKFGQSTIARQDISKSVPEEESEAFLGVIRALVKELDPTEENLRIEDTGLDVEIILTIDAGDDGAKDFSKADGVNYLNDSLGMGMDSGPNLVCGDTASDLPMLEAALAHTDETWTIFVTKNEDLAARVTKMCSKAIIVPEPDILVTILRKSAE